MRFFFVSIAFQWLFISVAFTRPFSSVVQSFVAFADEAINDWNVPGLAFSIVTPEEDACLTKTYGIRKVGSEESIDKNTIFRIASLSKGFSAALSVKLAHRGVIALDHPIIHYLPDVTIANNSFTKDIRIKHILSHTTGVMRFCMEHEAYKRQPLGDIIKNLKYAQRIGQPGQCFQYQNVIFSLLALIIERATGETFVKTMKKELLIPLGMDHTILTEAEYDELANMAHPHQWKEGRYCPLQTSSYYYNVLPAGGIASSISDMSQWLKVLLGSNPAVLDEKT